MRCRTLSTWAAGAAIFAALSACTTAPEWFPELPEGTGGPVVEERAPSVQVHVKWRTEIATQVYWQSDPRDLGAVVVSPGGDLLVGATSGWVYRVTSHDGEIRWGVPLEGAIDAPGVVIGDQVMIGTDLGRMVALDWATGEVRWSFEARGSVDSTPTVYGGGTYFFDSNDGLYAVDTVSGELLWEYHRGTPEFFTIKGGGQPLVEGDVVYAGFADGVLAALSREEGNLLWEVYLGPDSGEFGDVDLPIHAAGDRLFAASHAGGIYGIERATGALLWHVPMESVVALESLGTWLVAATATGRVFTLSGADGEIRWLRRFDEEYSPMGLSMVSGMIAVPMARGPMYWMSLDDGRVIARWKPSTGFQRPPVFDERRGYALSNLGYLYGFGLSH